MAVPSGDAPEIELRKLRKINRVLMDRVERDMDAHGGNAFSLFQTAITLEGRVSERTAELTRLTQRLMHEISERRETEKALLQAKAEADQANIGKTRFLAAASHDLHQPLNAARLFLGALADEVGGEGRPRQLVERVEAALETVSELIDTLLDISKLDAGAWTVVPTSFPIMPLLARLAEEYGPQAEACGLALQVVPSSATVHTDQVLLARVLRNLVSNAIRYTGDGRILIGCRQGATPGAISVGVWDTGIGIPEAKRARIFEEFQQLGVPPRRHEKGFGLGLAIVDRIARLLALDVTVRSRVGHGSCFAVRVPRGIPGASAGEGAAIALAPGGELEGLCVACIENEVESLQALEALLGSWGCCPVPASGLDAALGALAAEARRPDLILADYHLNGGSFGTDAITALRERFGEDIPAVVVSSDRAAAVQAEVEALGCGFLAKPLRPAKLRGDRLRSRPRCRRLKRLVLVVAERGWRMHRAGVGNGWRSACRSAEGTDCTARQRTDRSTPAAAGDRADCESYQMRYPTTALAQARWVMEARRSGVFISLFQALQQASTMVS